MPVLPGYLLNQKIWETSRSEVYRGIRNADKQKVVVKLLLDERPSMYDIARFEQEYALMMQLAGNGTVQALALERYNLSLAIIEEEGGDTLQSLLERKSFTIKEFLQLALKITLALEKVHQKNIIHKDINPTNILYQESTQQIHIIDFGMATTLAREVAEIRNVEVLQEGTLHYISPEQTGRMNRGIDYRTDYYSLGVTLYYMATGMLPFQSTDVAEIIHAHIAKLPTPPEQLRPDLPQVVSDIIIKLMSKRAEDRYQSLFGLKADLENCLIQFNSTGSIQFFPIGSKEISSRFQVSEKLYGREQQVDLLMKTFDKVTHGSKELLLVAGYSGIGKSSLVHELYQPVTEKRGYFISGKFDQYKKNIPHVAIIQALDEFFHQILTESEEKLQYWRNKIQQALHQNGKVITDLVPILTTIIGEQPPVAPLGANETKNRFELLFKNLIQCIAQPEHPLVLFIDDCQWSDVSSINLIDILLADHLIQHVCIILAYRDNEIDKNIIFIEFLNELAKRGQSLNKITILPLQVTDVQQMIADTLHRDLNEVTELTAILYQKTQGNPFFLGQFLQSLYLDSILEFNQLDGRWNFNINKINQKSITDNVVELMTQKIKKLSPSAQHQLSLAACFGNQFDLETLSVISEVPLKKTYTDLEETLKAGLIISIEKGYQFLHDRIQQAAYLLIPEEQRSEVHLSIGRLLLNNLSQNILADNVFDVVNHFNLGVELISTENEKLKLIELNISAGKKAKESGAFKAAYDYFYTGISLLNSDSWLTHYDLSRVLYTECIEAAFLANELTEVEELGQIAIQNIKELVDRVQIYQIKLRALYSQNNLKETVKLGLYVLGLLGIHFPKKPTSFHVVLDLIKTKWMLKGKSMEDIYRLPNVTDKNIDAASFILNTMASAAFSVDLSLTGLIILKGMQLQLKYGHHEMLCIFYVGFGLICTAFKEYDLSYQLGELALRVGEERFKSGKEISHIILMSSLTSPLKEHVDVSLSYLKKGITKGLETGFIEGATMNVANYLTTTTVAGKEIQPLIKEFYQYSNILQFMNIQEDHANINLQYLLNLTGQSEQTLLLKGSAVDETILVKTLADELSWYTFYRFKALLGFIFEDSSAYQYALKLQTYKNLDQVIFISASDKLIAALICLREYPNVSKNEQYKIIKYVKQVLKNMQLWSKLAPMNYLNKYYLLAAGLAYIKNEMIQAEDFFDKAIQLSSENRFIHEEGIANELAAKFYLARQMPRIAQIYLKDAHYCYSKWGAGAKVKQLEEKYPQLLRDKSDLKRASQVSFQSSGKLTSFFDLSSVMKSTQTITHEIELSTLLKKMMRIVIENAGAQRGFLLFEKSGVWSIEAEASIDRDEVSVLQSKSIEDNLSETILQYVIRTKSPVALDNACQTNQFVNDAYINRIKPKSILCVPLLNQGILSAVLYLENNIASGSFTQERIDILNVLCGQIVAAIDNAKLYAHLKALNTAQASFVPKELLNLLGKNDITEVKLGDQVQKEMTVMFCDIRNFTTLCENLDPESIMAFINEFLSKMEPVITAHHGLIDKYIGDAIMALFPKSADDAVRCAIAMLKALNEYNIERKRRLGEAIVPIQIGIGLNTGRLVLGTVGTAYRMEGTVLSDAVNVASRVESLTKVYHAFLLVTEQTYQKLQDPNVYALRKMDNSVYVKGKSVPIAVYEVFDYESEELIIKKYETLKSFEQAVELFWQGDYSQAANIFAQIAKMSPNDVQAKYYYQLCLERAL